LEKDKSKFNRNVAFVNNNFLFDMDTSLTFIAKQFVEYDKTKFTELPYDLEITEALSRFRSWLFEIVKLQDFGTDLLKARTAWQQSLEINPAYIRIYKRKESADKVIVNQVILSRHVELIKIGKVMSLDHLFDRPFKDENFKTMLHLNTDAIFLYWTNQFDSVMQKLLDKKIIFFNNMYNKWIVKLDQLTMCDSFLHGFYLLRKHMGTETTIQDVKIDAYDTYFK